MTKPNVTVPDEVPTAIAATLAVPGNYLPPRVGAATRRRILAPLELSLALERRTNSLVEAMKTSSHIDAQEYAPAALAAALPLVAAQDAWMTQHPSALLKFDDIIAASRGRQIIMFLDYDGTLSPIVNDPDSAFMSDSMRAAVREVARHFPTAIISGRCRDKVYKFERLADLYYAGSHGMDIKGPKQKKTKAKTVFFKPASDFLPMIDEVYKALVEKTKSISGAKVENNKFCLSVHYRCVDEKRWSGLAEQVKLVLKHYPKLILTKGRKVLEIRPTINWDKGKALDFLLESLGFSDCSDVLPVYMGDDRTDEDAFKVLLERGQGFGILVSKIAKETHATYSLQDPLEVMDFLHRLVDWVRQL